MHDYELSLILVKPRILARLNYYDQASMLEMSSIGRVA